MCGRYSLTKKPARLERTLGRELGPRFRPRYNIAPTQTAPLWTNDNRGQWKELRWGLIPSWAQDETIAARLINARCETIESKASFRSAFQKRRCLVPSDGFFEWRKTGTGREPVWIYSRDLEPFAFAGLWENWETAQKELQTFCIITTAANELIAPIHDRMPVILPQSNWHEWLDAQSSKSRLLQLLQPFPAEAMTFHRVDKRVNSVQFDDESCVRPHVSPQQTFFGLS